MMVMQSPDEDIRCDKGIAKY